MLKLLQTRLVDNLDSDGDGYYVRTLENAKLGPMTETQFIALRGSNDIEKVQSAWRIAGGNFYKVQLTRSVIWDTSHALSLKSINHICELVIIIVCFVCTVAVFGLLLKSPKMAEERKHAGEGMWDFMIFLFGITVFTGVFTVRTLIMRWRKASTEVYALEV